MRPDRAILSRRDPDVAAIVRAWRRLTTPRRAAKAGPGEKTLVACSGGADSVALVLALAAATDRLVVGHVVHDLREREECLKDRDVVRGLAERLGLEFVEAEVRVRKSASSGRAAGMNLEAGARLLRYDALVTMAEERGIQFIATAHHADDQLETVLMGLLRGSGLRGLSGMAEKRVVAGGWADGGGKKVYLIRPMLAAVFEGGITREVCRGMCGRAKIAWREDASNGDVSRLRAAVRHRVVPVMKEIRPRAAARATSAARLVRDASNVVEGVVMQCFESLHDRGATGGYGIARDMVAMYPDMIVGEVVRRMYGRVIGVDGYDALTSRALAPIVRAVRDQSGEKRDFRVGKALVRVHGRDLCVYPLKKGKA